MIIKLTLDPKIHKNFFTFNNIMCKQNKGARMRSLIADLPVEFKLGVFAEMILNLRKFFPYIVLLLFLFLENLEFIN